MELFQRTSQVPIPSYAVSFHVWKVSCFYSSKLHTRVCCDYFLFLTKDKARKIWDAATATTDLAYFINGNFAFAAWNEFSPIKVSVTLACGNFIKPQKDWRLNDETEQTPLSRKPWVYKVVTVDNRQKMSPWANKRKQHSTSRLMFTFHVASNRVKKCKVVTFGQLYGIDRRYKYSVFVNFKVIRRCKSNLLTLARKWLASISRQQTEQSYWKARAKWK